MPLLHLPNELLCCISENLELQRDINALTQANRRLYRLLNTYLYRFNIRHSGMALLWAVELGRNATAQKLLEETADSEATSNRLKRFLCMAAEKGHKEIVKLLLDKGVDVNAQRVEVNPIGTKYNNTHALEEASRRGHERVVELLLNMGANVNAQTTWYLLKQHQFENSNALYAALEHGNKQIVDLLLDKGADINKQSGKYGSALVAASACGRKQVVELLLEKGADDVARYGQIDNALQQ